MRAREPALSPVDFLEHTEHELPKPSALDAMRTSNFSNSLFLAPYVWSHFNSISKGGFSFYLVFCFFGEKRRKRKKKKELFPPISDFAILLV